MRIPTPANTAQQQVRVKFGKVKYDATGNTFNWVIKRFPGGQTYDFTANVSLISTLVKKTWARPPITLHFDVPVTSSGLQVRFLRVIEPKLRYETTKWVRYITRAGSYSIRIS